MPCPGDHLRRRLGPAFGQAVARHHEAGRGADQPVRPDSQGGVCSLQPVARVVPLIALQMDQRECHLGRAASRPGHPGTVLSRRACLGG